MEDDSVAHKRLYGVFLIALCILLYCTHPYLCFVDFISFSERAQRIPAGVDLLHPLYPVGYPALLSLLPPLWRLWFAKLLSFSGALCLLVLSERIFPKRGAFVLMTCGVWAQWGATEGTDMLAASLCIISIVQARSRPWVSTVCLGMACMIRYTAWLAFPIVLWYTTARIRLLLGVLICTSPHWGMVLSEGGRFWDQSENILRGARMGAWERIWATLRFLRTPLAFLGVLGLASNWSDSRSRALLLFGLFHCFAIAMVFPNDRLLLPAILSFALGCCYLDVLWSSRIRTFLLLAVAAFLSYPSGKRDTRWPGLNDLSKKLAPYEGRIFSPSASIYRSSNDGIEGTIPFQAVASNPIVSVSLLQQYGKEHEIRYLLLNVDKIRRYPKLAVLRASDAEECFEEWCIFRLQSLSGTRLERLQKVE